jgi:hypothetical protein
VFQVFTSEAPTATERLFSVVSVFSAVKRTPVKMSR